LEVFTVFSVTSFTQGININMSSTADGSSTPQQQPPDSIILEEEIDPNYVPTDQEVEEYAKWLGMNLVDDRDMLWIAREGLMAPLPKSWKPCKTKDTEDIYYFNFESGESTWDHPCDGYYKKIYEEEKKKHEIGLKVGNKYLALVLSDLYVVYSNATIRIVRKRNQMWSCYWEKGTRLRRKRRNPKTRSRVPCLPSRR
jgi:centrosomal protein CEP164